MQQKIRTKFKELFNTEGSLYTSPGRINLIGEHTDYNGGFVFPGAVDKGMIAEIKPNGTGKVRAFSIDLNDYAEFGGRSFRKLGKIYLWRMPGDY